MTLPGNSERNTKNNSDEIERIALNLEKKSRRSVWLGSTFVGLAIVIGLLITFSFLAYAIPDKFLAFFPVPPMNQEVEVPIYQFVLNAIIRIGAIFMALYVMQITVSLSRYHYRLADHLAVTADVLRISAGNANAYKTFATHMLPKVDFGKMPEPMMQHIATKALDVANNIARKGA